MCLAAADHCADQAGGLTGHGGSDQSSPVDRLSRYGIWGIAKTFSIPTLTTPVQRTDRTRFMAAFARLISPAAILKGGQVGHRARLSDRGFIETPRYAQMATGHLHYASLIVPLLAW